MMELSNFSQLAELYAVDIKTEVEKRRQVAEVPGLKEDDSDFVDKLMEKIAAELRKPHFAPN